jgi:hypothetical protein
MKKDNRLTLCYKYHLRGLSRASLIYLLVFVLVDLVLPLVLFGLFGRRVFGGDSTVSYASNFEHSPISYAFLLSSLIFLFVGFVASFREDFDFLLAMNSTRRNQFGSSLATLATASLAFFGVSLVISPLELIVESIVNRSSIASLFQDYASWFAADRLPLFLANLLLALVVFLGACSLGLTAGILSYRFGRLFVLPFWILFGTSFVFMPILIATNKTVQDLAAWFIGAGQSLPSLQLAWHLAVLAGMLLVLGGLAIRKLPQSST